MQYFKVSFLFLILFCVINTKKIYSIIETTKKHHPKVTIVIIIDQFAYHYIKKLRPHFRYGLKKILDHGIAYTNAYHPCGTPETAVGHNVISTGTLPKDNGINNNSWFDESCKEILYEDDTSGKAQVLNDPIHTKGISAKQTTVDGLSDQFMLHETNDKQLKCFSFSLKARSAVGTANQLGKALWFDHTNGGFTSSKQYFNTLPEWINKFNKKKELKKLTSIEWHLCYNLLDKAYNFPYIQDYSYASFNFSLANNNNITIDHTQKEPFDLYLKTPLANQLIIDCSKECMHYYTTKEHVEKMLLWVCLSALDLVGHSYGPDSLEAIDMIYHIDKQLEDLITYAEEKFGKNNVLFVVTGDHGIQPIPEISYKKGFKQARRINAQTLITTMNKLVEKKYTLKNFIQEFAATYFVFNPIHKKKLAGTKKLHKIITLLKNYLLKTPGIKAVWSYEELTQTTFEKNSLENFYVNSCYKGRYGDLICQPHPYCLLTKYPKGSSHETPYHYDTHVPLIFYQGNRFNNKQITHRVWTPQIPITIAKLIGISGPSASIYNDLPCIF